MARPRDPAAPTKRKLARAARRLVDAGGVGALTLRAAAGKAGVQPNATYFHFRGGITELIAAVALQGFEELIAALETPPLSLAAVDRASERVLRYVKFGVENPHLYRAMFNAQLVEPLRKAKSDSSGHDTFVSLRHVRLDAYMSLIEPLGALEQARVMKGKRAHASPGLTVAALAHGFVGEFIDEGLGQSEDEDPWNAVRQLTVADAMEIVLDGLLRAPATARRKRRK